jgi:FKBP-type peptidyl-prolyl cis-trans isomerase SlyD
VKIDRNTVVALTYELSDNEGRQIESSDAPIEYLHGDYEGIFPVVERALSGRSVGESCLVRLEPEDAFGEYDAGLVRMESRDKFPGDVTVGMRFEGRGEQSGETLVYTVTDLAEDKVVVDGNHPLAGRALNFSCTVTAVRAATEEEIAHGHVHGEHGHQH